MSEEEYENALDAALACEPSHLLLSSVVDLLFETGDEARWNVVESKVVAIATFCRWMLDGGFGTYFQMPGSVNSELVHDWISTTKLEYLKKAFEEALALFPGTDFEDVDERQNIEISDEMMDTLDRLDDAFYDNKDEIYREAENYIRRNRPELSWKP